MQVVTTPGNLKCPRSETEVLNENKVKRVIFSRCQFTDQNTNRGVNLLWGPGSNLGLGTWIIIFFFFFLVPAKHFFSIIIFIIFCCRGASSSISARDSLRSVAPNPDKSASWALLDQGKRKRRGVKKVFFEEGAVLWFNDGSGGDEPFAGEAGSHYDLGCPYGCIQAYCQ